MDRAADFKRLARLANGLFRSAKIFAMRWVTLNFGQTKVKIKLGFQILGTRYAHIYYRESLRELLSQKHQKCVMMSDSDHILL